MPIMQTLTIDLPESVYRQVQRQSHHSQRTVAEEVVAVVTSALPADGKIASDIDDELASMEFLSDEELRHAARAQVAQESSERLQFLLEKQQREGLTSVEKTTAESLSHYHDRVMLVRAKAAVLLKRRGRDISTLIPSPRQ
jgi:hypothetical protein